jgi:hypothetical protein
MTWTSANFKAWVSSYLTEHWEGELEPWQIEFLADMKALSNRDPLLKQVTAALNKAEVPGWGVYTPRRPEHSIHEDPVPFAGMALNADTVKEFREVPKFLLQMVKQCAFWELVNRSETYNRRFGLEPKQKIPNSVRDVLMTKVANEYGFADWEPEACSKDSVR